MTLLSMTDAQIIDIASPMVMDTIVGSRNLDWTMFSKHMPAEDASNEAIQADVEKQWKEHEYLTKFSDNIECLGVLRKTTHVLVVFKVTCSVNENEYLEKLYIEEVDGKILQRGIWTE